jgi:single-strand selective monofunctional uracil DNA glycosylase
MSADTIKGSLVEAARALREAVDALVIAPPVTHVYNPLGYAWAGYEAYLEKFARGPKRVVFLGMNPGPYGMAQVGVPFGAIPAVRDWMGIRADIGQPPRPHPKRPIEGFACPRVEVSGRRLWLELFAPRYPRAEDFFADHFVLNYCPLVFMTATGANHTPDKLPAATRAPLEAACDAHLRRALECLQPQWAVGVGAYAEKNLARVCDGLATPPRLTRIIHPAPASPVANREWPENPRRALEAAGVW